MEVMNHSGECYQSVIPIPSQCKVWNCYGEWNIKWMLAVCNGFQAKPHKQSKHDLSTVNGHVYSKDTFKPICSVIRRQSYNYQGRTNAWNGPKVMYRRLSGSSEIPSSSVPHMSFYSRVNQMRVIASLLLFKSKFNAINILKIALTIVCTGETPMW